MEERRALYLIKVQIGLIVSGIGKPILNQVVMDAVLVFFMRDLDLVEREVRRAGGVHARGNHRDWLLTLPNQSWPLSSIR